MDLLAAPQELPRVGVERQVAEPESHRPPMENPENPHDFLKTRGERGSILAPYCAAAGVHRKEAAMKLTTILVVFAPVSAVPHSGSPLAPTSPAS